MLDQSILISDAISNPAVKVVGEPFTVDPYGIGITKSDPSAKKFVDAWLQKIYDDGSWAKALEGHHRHRRRRGRSRTAEDRLGPRFLTQRRRSTRCGDPDDFPGHRNGADPRRRHR